MRSGKSQAGACRAWEWVVSALGMQGGAAPLQGGSLLSLIPGTWLMLRVWGRHLGMGGDPAFKEVLVDCERKAPRPRVPLRKELTGEPVEPHGSNILWGGS